MVIMMQSDLLDAHRRLRGQVFIAQYIDTRTESVRIHLPISGIETLLSALLKRVQKRQFSIVRTKGSLTRVWLRETTTTLVELLVQLQKMLYITAAAYRPAVGENKPASITLICTSVVRKQIIILYIQSILERFGSDTKLVGMSES